jgi:predicted permease
MRIEHWLYTVPLRLRSLFRRPRVEDELDEELQYHLERRTEEFVAQGMPPAAARHAALRAMDGLTQHKEECRDQRRVRFLEDLFQDLRYGLRVLRKSPGFASVAVLTLALAIGANAVVFGVLNALILHPLDVPRPESLYGIQHGDEASSNQSYPDYLDLRDRNRSFEDLAAYNINQFALDTGDNLSTVWCEENSGNYFDALRIQPYLGRFFHASEEHGPDSVPYVVLSYASWHNRFAGDPGVVGRVIRLNRRPFTIAGVAPPGFRGTLVFGFPELFVPLVDQPGLEGHNNLDARGARWIFMAFGHLKAGVTPAQAAADLNSIGAWLEKTYPREDTQRTFTLARPSLYGDYLGRPVRAFLTALMLLAGLILLAACANLGSLFAARAADRGREVALRLALGSTRGRILRTLLTEAVLISLAGGAAGLLGSVWLLRALSNWHPISRFPDFHVPISPDANVYVVALILALLSGILFGIVPVRQVLRTDPYQIVKAGSAGRPGRRFTVRDLLLGLQIAICAVLVTSSLVAVRGLVRSLHAGFGFEPRNALLLGTVLDMAGYRGAAVPEMQKRMLDTIRQLPGVASAGLIDWAPLSNGSWHSTFIFPADAADFRQSHAIAEPVLYSVSPDYFRAAGTALLAGRDFTWHDDPDAPRVAAVNREFARRIFGGVDSAPGRAFKLRDGARIQVVAVVEDGKYKSLAEDPQPAMFFPLLQSPASDTSMVVRSSRDPRLLAASVRNALRGLDSGLPCEVITWNRTLDIALLPSRVATFSLGVLGAMGAMLSLTGIFGMAAYSVSRRLRELGIRLALGARRSDVLQAALGRAVKLLAIGSAAGLILGILSARVLASIVYQATPRDPVVLAGVVLAMSLLGLLATWIPARRALSLDPVTLLREE